MRSATRSRQHPCCKSKGHRNEPGVSTYRPARTWARRGTVFPEQITARKACFALCSPPYETKGLVNMEFGIVNNWRLESWSIYCSSVGIVGRGGGGGYLGHVWNCDLLKWRLAGWSTCCLCAYLCI